MAGKKCDKRRRRGGKFARNATLPGSCRPAAARVGGARKKFSRSFVGGVQYLRKPTGEPDRGGRAPLRVISLSWCASRGGRGGGGGRQHAKYSCDPVSRREKETLAASRIFLSDATFICGRKNTQGSCNELVLRWKNGLFDAGIE